MLKFDSCGKDAGRFLVIIWLLGLCAFVIPCSTIADEPANEIDLGLSVSHLQEGKEPAGWKLRKGFWRKGEYSAAWTETENIRAVKLHSKAGLCFLERKVDIDIRKYQAVSWMWRVDNVLQNIDERTLAGDDHPIRIFFVFKPDNKTQSFWFRLKRVLYLDAAHGHAMGGRFTEYLWSSYLPKGEVIKDPGKPMQKLMVIEGGTGNVGKWLRYKRNLYEDFKKLYNEEPRRLIFIGILNDTDATGQEATSYIADLRFETK